MKCCFCKRDIPVGTGWMEGNNAEPVVKMGRCCDECNQSIVIPCRVAGIGIRKTGRDHLNE